MKMDVSILILVSLLHRVFVSFPLKFVHVQFVGREGEENSRKEERKVGREEDGGGKIPIQEDFLLEEIAVVLMENES